MTEHTGLTTLAKHELYVPLHDQHPGDTGPTDLITALPSAPIRLAYTPVPRYGR